MASGPNEACFLPPDTCHNCERKCTDVFQDTNEAEVKKVYSRCSGCFLLSYCDETCQLEHWNHVHKYHCQFLYGQKNVQDHDEDSCQNCIEKNTSGKEELLSIKSPKIGCKIEEENKKMRKNLGYTFGFHKIATDHICSVEFGCHHPFPMGEIPGGLVCTGLDEMMVHAAKLSNAMIVKTLNDKIAPKETINELIQLHKRILSSRLILWQAVLIFGNTTRAEFEINKQLCEFSQSLNKKFEKDNVWWRALAFTLDFICHALYSQNWGSLVCLDSGLKDPNLQELNIFHKDQITKYSSVSQNKMWNLFKQWPTLVNQSLQLVLPQDTSCTTCKADLSGHIAVPDNDSMTVMAPHAVLFPRVSNEGGLLVTCPPAQKIRCVKDFVANTTDIDMTDEALKEKKQTEVKGRICQLCMKTGFSAHRCKICLAVQYCSMDCATKDFAFHKTVCSAWSKDPTRKLMSGKQQKKLWKSFQK